MAKLAINGGPKLRTQLFPAYQVLGEDEAKIAYDVVKTGVLSKFLGCWHPDFYGGPQVQAFEKEWAEHFNVKHAITVNSNSSGIICALGALNIGPGDEVIVTGYSMSISASAPLFYGAVPVFADVEEDYFCIDPVDVEKKITKRTKAIIAVDLFGLPYDAEKLNEIARIHGIPIIEDSAQAPDSKLRGKYAGTLGDLGVFSLNYHKHIHTGEGGVIVTDSDELAQRCQLIRNHAEAVVDGMNYSGSLVNMIGFNMRMPEIEAAIGRSLLRKMPDLLDQRRKNVAYLEKGFSGIEFMQLPKIRPGAVHSYYAHGLKFHKNKAGISREKFVKAIKAELMPSELREGEGVLLACGYVKPLYLQSVYQKRIGFGTANYPFEDPANMTKMKYEKGICPVTENLHFQTFFAHEFMRPGMRQSDLDTVIDAFHKVTENLNELKE